MNERSPSEEVHVADILQIAKGAGIIFFGALFGGGVLYLFHVYIARVLGPDDYGLFALGLAAFSILSVISLVGTRSGLIRYVARFNGQNDMARVKGTMFSAAGIVASAGLVLSLILFFFSDSIAVSIFQKGGLGPVLRIFGASIPFFGIAAVFVSAAQGLKIMRYYVYVFNVWEPVGKLILAALFFTMGYMLIGAALAHLITLALGSLLAYRLLKKHIALQLSNPKPIFEMKQLMAFSFPVFFITSLYIGRTRIDRLILGYFQSSGDVGLYTAAFQTSILCMIVLISFTSIFAPIISDLHSRRELRQLKRLFKTTTKWIFSLTVPFSLFVFFFSGEILGLFGDRFVLASVCLKIIIISQLINSCTGPSGSMLVMSGHPRIEVFNSLAAFLLQMVLCFILIPRYSFIGAAIAGGISLSVLNILRIVEIYRILKMHPYRIDFFKPICAGGILTILMYALRSTSFLPFGNLVVLGCCGCIVLVFYGLVLFVLKLEPEDRIIVDKLMIRFSGQKT